MSTYNEKAGWIQESIESILNQTYRNLEFIIVLDNPDNDSIEGLVRGYSIKDPRIVVIKNDSNLGLTASLNKALLVAKGYYVARMDADDVSVLDRLEKQVNYISDENMDFVFSAMNIMSEAGEFKFSASSRALSSKTVNALSGIANVSNHPTWFLKKSVYDMLGGYRDVPFCEDYDFVLRSISYGFRLGRMPDLLLSYRIRESSITSENGLEQFHNVRGLKKLFKQNKLDDAEELARIINESKDKSTDIETMKFNRRVELLSLGINEIKNKKVVKGFLKILKVCSVSHLLAYRIRDWLKFKIVERRFNSVIIKRL